MDTHIMWYTLPTQYVDIETGENIHYTKLHNYITVKTDKTTVLNANKTIGHIQYTILCKPNPQLKLDI